MLKSTKGDKTLVILLISWAEGTYTHVYPQYSSKYAHIY